MIILELEQDSKIAKVTWLVECITPRLRVSPAGENFARTVKELRPHCERASVNNDISKLTPILLAHSFFFSNKERLSVVLNCFYICNLFRNSISSVSTFSSSFTVRVFLVFQTKNPEPILNCALIGRISSNQVACQRSAVWRLGLEIFIFFF